MLYRPLSIPLLLNSLNYQTEPNLFLSVCYFPWLPSIFFYCNPK